MSVTSLRLPFGHSGLIVDIPTGNLVELFLPQEDGELLDEATLLHTALVHPIGSPPLRDLTHRGEKIVIVTSDLTRPCPSDRLLPPVLDQLAGVGVAGADVTVLIGLGLHRPMTERELEQLVGSDVYHRIRVINHNPADTVRLDVTSAGTPVEISRPVVEADCRICLGNLEFHYLAGFTGGAKAILPG